MRGPLTADTTPGGCNLDNGRAFQTIERGPNKDEVKVTFHDGSRYVLTPVTPAEYEKMLLRSKDPGCWFNHVLLSRPDYHYVKLNGPTS